MPRFRKKPIVIEAEQLTKERVLAYLSDKMPLPPGVKLWSAHTLFDGSALVSAHCAIDTLEGEMTASIGDWIITGVKGEHYACKPDIFEATYEPADPPGGAQSGAPETDYDESAR
jgi:hypothetical protein